MRILYGIGSWGLGHATRSLPVIQALLADGHDITVISSGRALLWLRRELDGTCEFLDWPHLQHTLGRSALEFHLRSALALPAWLHLMWWERARTRALLRRRPFDRIISDNRYGVQDPGVPSFHVAHSLRFIAPGRVAAVEYLLEAFNYSWFRGLRRVIVPDTPEDALAGDLAHRLRIFPPELLAYVGILSHARARPLPQDLDVFISVSGPEPQRSLLERLIRDQTAAVPGRVVVALGRPERSGVERIGRVEFHESLDGRGQEEMINRARIVVARAGFSTLLSLAEVGRRAVLIPTPGQTEQEYLAAYHRGRGAAASVPQARLRLSDALEAAGRCRGLSAGVKTAEAVRRVVKLIRDG